MCGSWQFAGRRISMKHEYSTGEMEESKQNSWLCEFSVADLFLTEFTSASCQKFLLASDCRRSSCP
jgi:hypothetical protein